MVQDFILHHYFHHSTNFTSLQSSISGEHTPFPRCLDPPATRKRFAIRPQPTITRCGRALNELMQYSLETFPLFLKQLKEMNFPIQVSPKASQEWVLSLVLWRVAWALGTCTGSSPEKFGLA